MATMDTSNTNFQLAIDFIRNTNRPVFLTGKAGTGKTTFLKYIKEHTNKQTVVLAPTGVAAINAGGVTMHSFFNLPFGPFLPGTKKGFSGNGEDGVNDKHSLIGRLKYNKEKRELLQSLELMIIDEVSMVRSDILDAIDTILKTFRRNFTEPFGGVQVLFIGDMFQLPPVVKEDEWQMLQEYYNSPFFFDSLVLKEDQPLHIELEKIYRQSDQHFIDVLNQVRNNRLDEDGSELLHSRYLPDFYPHKNDGYVTLTTHNYKADSINGNELEKLAGKPLVFKAEIKGDFNERLFPAEENMHLKIGAQVMFIKNDAGGSRRYFNGKIGTIKNYDEEEGKIYVLCDGEEQKIEVKKETWKNIRYSVNKDKQQLEEDEIGSFTQFPLRLAWAITIHKSQGLTFEKAIIDAGAAFAPGQVYVALSRCTSLEGLVLHSRINASSVFTDERIARFAKQKNNAAQLMPHLQEAKFDYQCSLLTQLFDLSSLTKTAISLEKILNENLASFNQEAMPYVQALKAKAISLQEVAAKFQQQLRYYFKDKILPEENTVMQQRLQDAATWFASQLNEGLLQPVKQSPTVTDSKNNATLYYDALHELNKAAMPKHRLMEDCKEGFNVDRFLKTKSRTGIAMLVQTAYAGAPAVPIKSNSPHPTLLKQLRQLRDELCKPKDLPIYLVAGTATLEDMARYLPQTQDELMKISGFGLVKIAQFGDDFLKLIHAYCIEKNLGSLIHEKDAKRIRKEKNTEPKPDTKLESYKLFKAGKTIPEIAVERGFTTGTIETHLGHFVLTGELQIEDVLSKTKIDLIVPAVKEIGGTSSAPIKEKIGTAVSYAEVKLVMQWLEKEKAEQ
jgi:PIF1-like helicase/Helix-turn-helix domain/HRDC domain/Helicase